MTVEELRIKLINKFVDGCRKYEGVRISDVPELKEAFENINNFEKACESIGYKFNVE